MTRPARLLGAAAILSALAGCDAHYGLGGAVMAVDPDGGNARYHAALAACHASGHGPAVCGPFAACMNSSFANTSETPEAGTC